MQNLYTFFDFSHYISMKSSVGKGAFILIISGLVCKFFGALFRLPLTNIIKLEGIGLFQMIMSLYSLSIVIVSGGVSSALSKLVSSARAKGDQSKISGFFKTAIIFGLGLSFAIGILFFLFSKQIAVLQGNGDGSINYMLFILLLPLGSMIGIFRGIIQGYENMTPTAISQILEQMSKFVFGLAFAYLFAKNSTVQGVFGAFLGIVISEVLAFVYLAIIVIKKIKLSPQSDRYKKEFFLAVTPLTISGAIYPLTQAIEALIIISLLSQAGLSSQESTAVYGIQTGVVGAILNFPLIISMSVAVALLPKVSFLSSQNDEDGQRQIIGSSFSIMWFILVPLIFGIISISGNLYPIIYPQAMENYLQIAVQLTLFSGISILLTAIMQFLLSVLQGKGFFYYCLAFNAIGGLFKILMTIILAPLPSINIFALPISSIVHSSIVCICALIKLGKIVKVSFFEFMLPIISSIIMYLVIGLLQESIGGIWSIVLSVIVGCIVYGLCAFPLVAQYGRQLFEKLKMKKQQ